MKTATRQRREVKSGRALYKLFVPEVKILSDKGQATFVMSGQVPDRDGDVIHQDGWDLADFERHPILLADHNYRDITAQIGEWSDVHVEGKATKSKLIGTANYYVGEGNEKADWAFNLAKKGRGAVSVGFIPLKFEIIEDDESDSWWPPVEFFQQSLLECSAVTVPAHQDALQTMMNDKSFDPVLRKIASDMLEDEDFTRTLRQPRMKSGSVTKCLADECEREALSGEFLMCSKHANLLMQSVFVSATKGGRALSKANEDRLQSAYDLIGSVLDQVKAPGDDDEPDEDDKPGAKPGADDGDEDDKKSMLRSESSSDRVETESEEKKPKPAPDDDEDDNGTGDEGANDDDSDDTGGNSKDDMETCCMCCEQSECKDYPSCSSDTKCCAEGEAKVAAKGAATPEEDSNDGGKDGHEDDAEELTISPQLLADLIRSIEIEPEEED